MIQLVLRFRQWLRTAGVDLSGVAITIHVKRDRDAYLLMSALVQDTAYLQPGSARGVDPVGQIAGIPFEIKVDELQRDLDLRR